MTPQSLPVTPAQPIPQGLAFNDPIVVAANNAYLASLHPEVLALYAGTFGQPGATLAADVRMAIALKLAGQGFKVQMETDAMGWLTWYAYMSALTAGGYTVFSYIGEPNPDWTTSRPGDSEPGLPPYNASGHTGVVSFVPPAPFVPPPPAPAPITSLIGPWTGANTGQLGIPGPVVNVYEPSVKTLIFMEYFPCTDHTVGSPTVGEKFLWHIEGNELMDANMPAGEGVWLGPMPASS